MEWYMDFANVLRLAHWLVEERCFDAEEILRYFETSWKWTNEWKEMQAATELKP